MNTMKKSFTKALNTIKTRTNKPRKKISTFINKRPFATLFSLLGILVVMIIISNIFQKPPAETEKKEVATKKVEVYRIGEAPKLKVQAQIEKSGVVTITALSPGVVQQIYVEPGTQVSRGKTLLSTSSNYQGGNALALQASIASRQLQNVNETYDTQKDLIAKQKEVAEKSQDNDERLREITRDSLDDTKGLIDLNNSILDTLDDQITNAPDDSTALTYKQLKSQFLSANNQLNSSLRNAEYSSDEASTAAALSDLQKDITLKQLDIQEKALDLNRDVSRLQYQAAQVQAATMFPSAPFNAVVQRVNVKVGQAVQPGTPLVVLSQAIEEDPIVAIAYVPREIAQKVSYMEPSMLTIGDFEYETYPSYVTQDAINGSLYGVYFPIPDIYHQHVTNDGYISVEMPIGYFDTGSAIPYIPIDSVYQTEKDAFIFVDKKGIAESKKIQLGNVIGRYVEVTSGLNKGDIVILNRNIISGDKIKIQ
jgi:multidrug efflux pump subunit AcrA (membrane-fusion protein)